MVTLGWVKKSPYLSFRADWSRIGVEEKVFNKFDTSLTTFRSSIKGLSSCKTSLPAEGSRGYSLFQKPLGVVAVDAESAQKGLITTRFSLVTKFLCVLWCSHKSLVGWQWYYFVQLVSQSHCFLYLYIDPGELIWPDSLFHKRCVFLYSFIK